MGVAIRAANQFMRTLSSRIMADASAGTNWPPSRPPVSVENISLNVWDLVHWSGSWANFSIRESQKASSKAELSQ